MNKILAKSTRAGFGDGLMDIAERIPSVVTIDADLRHSVQTMKFAKAYPNRAFQVGIAEQNMVGVAAGLAQTGKIPFAASFAVFVTGQAYNQIRQSVSYSETNVKLVGSHAGVLTGEDGATHQALEDISLMRTLPHMRVYCPADYHEARAMTALIAEEHAPTYFRLGRSDIPTVYTSKKKFKLGSLEVLRTGKTALVFATGTTVPYTLQAAIELAKKGITLTVVNASTLKPFPTKKALALCAKAKLIFTAEDHQIVGGLGSIIAETLADAGLGKRLIRLGLHDTFGMSGTWQDCLSRFQLDMMGLMRSITAGVKKYKK